MSAPRADVSVSETELSTGWAEENPELFLQAVIKFNESHPDDAWERAVDFTRGGFLVIRAERWDSTTDVDMDVLTDAARAFLLVPGKPWRKAVLQGTLDHLKLTKVNEAKTRLQFRTLLDLFQGGDA